MILSLILFLIGVIGFVLNRKNLILMLISIEIMLLAITLLILVSSLSFDDILGQTYAVYIISIAGAESAIGLGILVAFYRLNHYIPRFPFSVPNKTMTNLNTVRYYSTKSIKSMWENDNIGPLFINGFVDAKASFVVTITKRNNYKTGWSIQTRF